MKKKKLLIISVSAGAGHVRAADALLNTANQHFPEFEVRHIDMMEYVSAAMRATIVDVYGLLIKSAPSVWRALYNFADTPKRMKHFYNLAASVNRVNARKFYAYLDKFQPDQVLCTHSFPAQVLKQSKQNRHKEIPVSLVITDYGLHKFWLVEGAAQYFCATEDMEEELKKRIDAPVVNAGIPVDPAFYESVTMEEEQNALSIPRNRKVLLFLSGGVGSVKLDKLLQAFQQEVTQGKYYCIAIAGKNTQLKKKLDALQQTPEVHIQSVGWTNEMHRYMRASDVVVTKPGGLTTSECAVLQKQMIFVDPVPGQEECNAAYWEKRGLGVIAASDKEMISLLQSVKGKRHQKIPKIEASAAWKILETLKNLA